jgi:F-type H+-transporting ATPase subunit delta
VARRSGVKLARMKPAKQTKREAARLFRLCVVNGLLDEARVRQVVERVIAGKRRGYLALLSFFHRLVKLEHARHTAEVASAAPLPADLQVSVQADLQSAYGAAISILFAHRPELIGGMRIQVGSDVYDSSVRARLAALEQRF